jgi:hypothetical protein
MLPDVTSNISKSNSKKTIRVLVQSDSPRFCLKGNSQQAMSEADQDDQAQSLGSFKTLRSAASALFSSTL